MSTDPDAKYASAALVKRRYGGVSDMWIVRRLAEQNFPQPYRFGTATRFWSLSELDAWDASMRDRAINAPKQP